MLSTADFIKQVYVFWFVVYGFCNVQLKTCFLCQVKQVTVAASMGFANNNSCVSRVMQMKVHEKCRFLFTIYRDCFTLTKVTSLHTRSNA